MKKRIITLLFAAATVVSLQAEIIVTSSGDSGEGSLRKAIEDAESGSTITVASDVTDIVLDDEIVITKTLTIDGQGATLSVAEPGTSTYRLFNIGNYAESGNTECDVVLQNLILKGGNVTSRTDNSGKGANGGLIHVETASTGAINFTMLDCTLSDGKGNNGGALTVNNATGIKSVRLERCVFQNNNGVSGNGAALLRTSAVTIKDCRFESNAANGASVLTIDQAATTSVAISGSHFKNNTSATSGRGVAAISLNRIAGPITIDACTFEGNTNSSVTTDSEGTGDGASVISSQCADAQFLIQNSTFYGNSGIRGTVYVHTGSAQFVHNTFAGNRANYSNYGGAIWVTSDATASVTFVNNIFAYNYAINNRTDIYLGGNAVRAGSHNIIGGYAGGSSAINALTNTHLFAYGSDPVDDEDLFENYTTNSYDKKIPVLDVEKNVVLLSAESIARNAATDTYDGITLPTVDQLGVEREAGTACLGAVEYVIPTGLKAQQATQTSVIVVAGALHILNNAPVNRIDLFDMSGKTVLSKKQPSNIVSLPNVNGGLYIVRLDTADGTVYNKLIIK